MRKFLKRLALGFVLALPWIGAASAQQANNYCWVDNGPPIHWTPCTSTNPLPVSGTFTPSGTQSVNIAQILGAAPSLTNPLWVFPATGATFPVSIAAAPLQPIGLALTDRTITSASGASQQIMAANATRHSMTIENTGNANCGVNPTGGTAAIGGAGTITLAPLGAYTPHVPSVSAVTVICTAGQPIYGDEN